MIDQHTFTLCRANFASAKYLRIVAYIYSKIAQLLTPQKLAKDTKLDT